MTAAELAAVLVPALVALLGAGAVALRRWARALPARDAITLALSELRRDIAEHRAHDERAHDELTRAVREELTRVTEARVVEARATGAALERTGAQLERLADLLTEPASAPPPPRARLRSTA